MAEVGVRKPRRLSRRSRQAPGGVWYPRWFWPSFASPATLVLILLFVVPFYAILAVAFGTTSPIFNTAEPVWNPLHWNADVFRFVLQQAFLRGGIYQPAFLRTLLYVAAALCLCLVVGYPVAYYIARYGGPWKKYLLIALITPFWISYLMRMLAWINLLQDDGLVNKALLNTGIIGQPIHWLEGQGFTVVLGLVYGYIPYMILPLYGALDRIDVSLLEAARDLGASPARTFARVTLPLSKQAILAGSIIVTLPMFGDYYTNDLLSASPRTSMIGTLINRNLNGFFLNRAASIVLLLTALLVLPMLYYLYATARATRERLA